jgi:hypothetical protein
MARISGFSVSSPAARLAGLLTEVIGIDLGLVHVAAPTRASQGRRVSSACVLFGQAGRLAVVTDRPAWPHRLIVWHRPLPGHRRRRIASGSGWFAFTAGIEARLSASGAN